MPTFKYKALKDDGSAYQDTAQAPSKEVLYQRLKKKGESLVTAEIAGQAGDMARWRRTINSYLSGVSQKDKIMFARNIGAMIDAGLPMSRALDVINRQTNNIALQEVVASIQDTIEAGGSLSAGLQKHADVFSSLFVQMVRAGEESGNLPEAFDTIATQIKRAYTLKKKIRGAMMYPAIILVAMILVGIAMMIYVVPTLSSTFKEMNVDLPASTQLVITISDFLQNYTILSLAGLAGTGAGMWGIAQTSRGKRAFEWLLLSMPLVGPLVKQTNAARTARTLSSLLSSGVNVVHALEITEGVVQNSYYEEVLAEAQDAVKHGEPLAQVFQDHEDLYPPFVGEMAAVGEETGKTASMLKRVAEFYEEEVKQKTDDMSTIVEPFLMIVIGVVVGFFAISMISPMYSLTGKI
jgi:type IV pilus assembly protein PilC